MTPWAELADHTGLTYQVAQLKFSGTYRGRLLKLDAPLKIKSWQDIFLTILQYFIGALPDLNHTRIMLSLVCPPGFHLFLTSSGRKTKGFVTGDEAFYQQFRVEGNPKDFVSGVLTHNFLRKRLMDVKGSIKIDRMGLIFLERGIENNIKRLHSIFDLLCDVAEHVEHVTKSIREMNNKR
jgi:hypothetical protein